MNKIVILTNELKINEAHYPFNSLFFEKKGDVVRIFTIGGELITESIYTSFVNENDEPYLTAQSVIDVLRNSFV